MPVRSPCCAWRRLLSHLSTPPQVSQTTRPLPRASPAPGCVQVTLRNCTTGLRWVPRSTRSSRSTAAERSAESAGGVAFAPGQRSPGHGTWAREGGHTYRQDMVALLLFDTQPNLPGRRPSTRPNRCPRASSPDGRPSATRSRLHRRRSLRRRKGRPRSTRQNGSVVPDAAVRPQRARGSSGVLESWDGGRTPPSPTGLRSSCRRSSCGRARNRSACRARAASACWWRHPPGTSPWCRPARRSSSRHGAG